MEVLHELHRAAAAGSPHVVAWNRGELDPALTAEPATPDQVAALAALLAHPGVDPDVRAQPSGATPLHAARYFGQRALADLLLARGADPTLRDALGRTPDQLASFPIIARAIRTCRRLPAVRAAYLSSIYTPHTHQFTSPLLGLELAGQLPVDAFAGWPDDLAVVVFGLGDDAISRLVRLARPIYTAPPAASGLGIARAIAALLDERADVVELPSRDHSKQLGVVVGDALPVLVRDFGHAFGVCVGAGDEQRAWSLLATADTATVVADAAAFARAYLAAHPERPTLAEIAHHLTRALAADADAAATGPWTVQIPGTPEPSEMWLHGGSADASAVGLFVGAAHVRAHRVTHRLAIATRAALVAAGPAIAARVREQRAAHAANAARSEQIRAVATALATELTARIPATAWTVATRGFATYDHVATATLACDGIEHVRVEPAEGDDRLLTIAVADLRVALAPDAPLPAARLAEAVALARRTFAIEQLAPGMCFEVLADLGDLAAGMRVEYLGYDDLDNHHGRYRFRDGDGNERLVHGDGSTPRNGPLGEAHRFLRPI